MKKLLLTLASLGTVVIPITTVVACGSDSKIHRFDTPVLGQKLNDQIFMALLSDPSIAPEIKGKYFNDIDFQQATTVMLEDQISKVANSYYQNNINKNLMLETKPSSFYHQQLDTTINTIAQNQFYLEYTKNLVTNGGSGNPLDINISIGNDNLIKLNPSKLLQPDEIGDVKMMDDNQYFVFYQSEGKWKRWEYFNENDDQQQQIPQIKELENSKFVIVKKTDTTNQSSLTNEQVNGGGLIWLEGQDRHDDPKDFVYSLDGKTPFFMNGKTALQYRFQDYFRSQIRYSTDENKSLAKRMLAITYLEANLFNVYRNAKLDANQPANDAYLNINSDVAQSVQTWNKNVGYQSKLKLVWSFTMNNRDEANKVWKLIRPYLDNNDQLINPTSVSLKSLYKEIEEQIIANQSNVGSDPFFNLNGYNGIVKNDKDTIIPVDGNLVIDEAAKAKIAQANAPAILSNGLGDPFNSNVKGKFDFVFVVPLYLIDLLNDKTQGYDYGQTTTIYIPKNQVRKTLDPANVYPSFSEAQNQGKQFNSLKIDDINRALNSSIPNNTKLESYYVLDTMGAPYTLAQWNQRHGTNYTPENVWTQISQDSNSQLAGLQVAIKNTHDRTTGNIGLNGEPVRLFPSTNLPANPPQGLTFSLGNDGYLYVRASDPNLLNSVQSFKLGNQEYYLSFDDASKEGVITTTGIVNKSSSTFNNTTYGDPIHMGQNASNPTSYIKDESVPFDYYESQISSLDVANLNTTNKISLLREIESIVAVDDSVINRASSAIYPLFLKENDILFNPLYASLKKYLINEGGGTSD